MPPLLPEERMGEVGARERLGEVRNVLIEKNARGRWGVLFGLFNHYL